MEQVITSWWITEEHQLQAAGGGVAFGNKCPNFDGFHTRMGSYCTAPPTLDHQRAPSTTKKTFM